MQPVAFQAAFQPSGGEDPPCPVRRYDPGYWRFGDRASMPVWCVWASEPGETYNRLHHWVALPFERPHSPAERAPVCARGKGAGPCSVKRPGVRGCVRRAGRDNVAVTIRDVAQAAGVHVSTVSRTFSASHLVKRETRERVLAIAEDLGYRPNQTARALTTGRTRNLGLIVADIANPFFPPLIKAAQACARIRGYQVFVADTDEDVRAEEELIRTLARQVDGVILVSPRLANDVIAHLGGELPFILVNRQVTGLSAVLMDVAHGAARAVQHLAELGHEHLALACGPRGSWTSAQMRRAAGKAAGDRGIRLDVLGPNPPTEHGGIAATPAVLSTGATGVIAYNDLVAIGLIEGLDDRGVRVPGDISVVGVDDTVAGRLYRPRLTTVAMPTASAGRTAVDLLIQAVETPGTDLATAQTVLATSLVVRDSTTSPRSRASSVPEQPEQPGLPK